MSPLLTQSQARLGGILSIGQAAVYVIAAGAALAVPLREITTSTEALADYYARSPMALDVIALSLIVLGLLGIMAVVPATAALLESPRSGLVTLGRNVALLSLAVGVTYYTWFVSTIGRVVVAYRAVEPSLRPLVALHDPHAPANWVAWFLFGGMGVWVLVVGESFRGSPSLSRGFPVACVIKAGGFFVALAGVVFGSVPLMTVGIIAGGLLGGPLYHVWLGGILLRRARGLP